MPNDREIAFICVGCLGCEEPGSSTLHVLGLGEHELEAVLLVDSVASTASRQLGFPLTLMAQHWCQPQIAHLIIHKQIFKVLLSGF
jgi:hypothetical protein